MALWTRLLTFQPWATLLPDGVAAQSILACASNDLASLSIQIPAHNCLEPLRPEYLHVTVQCLQTVKYQGVTGWYSEEPISVSSRWHLEVFGNLLASNHLVSVVSTLASVRNHVILASVGSPLDAILAPQVLQKLKSTPRATQEPLLGKAVLSMSRTDSFTPPSWWQGLALGPEVHAWVKECGW